jgi:hypothetical protein
MIFSREWYLLEGSYYTPSQGNLICVYQGEQPSIEDYVTNFESLYSFSSSNILQLIWKTPRPVIITDPENSEFTQALKSFNSGIATWASCIEYGYDGASGPQYNIEGYYFITDHEINNIQSSLIYQGPREGPGPSNIANSRITIVPVSDLTDNGVIKFRSTSFSHPDESDEDRAIDMKIIPMLPEGVDPLPPDSEQPGGD